MTQWAIPLSVALVAAAASIAAAYITYAKDRRDARAQILQDLEIAEKLPESVAKDLLTTYAQQRATLLPLEHDTRSIARRELIDLLGLTAVFAIVNLAEHQHVSIWRYFLAFFSAQLLVTLRWRGYRRKVDNLVRQYLVEKDLYRADDGPDLITRSFRPSPVWSYLAWLWHPIKVAGLWLRRKLGKDQTAEPPAP
ncbi:hypothetical protein [Mycobacterium paraintracellulare]|uniref:hypothetical protein n=1 Tax=Mycobacterium paraintracellulare TaxID=1138383 RepID=UPI0019276859|nr:hypothetical protein [Mycobacterium paraintracellulare]